MTELNDKVLKAIQESLPGATAGELKKFIEEANANKQALVIEKEESDNLRKERDILAKEKSKYETAEALSKGAYEKLEQAKELERSLKFDIQTEQIKQRDFVINKFEGFLNNLVKNPRAIEMINETRNVPVFEQYSGGGGFHTTKPEWTTGTNEKVETKD